MNISVELLHHTPLEIAIKAIRKCYQSQDKSDSFYPKIDQSLFELGQKDKALIQRIIDSGHHSTIEHLNFTFDLKGYSRALLQEKSRHRIASVSEKSTRYCLAELKTAPQFYNKYTCEYNWDEAKKYLVMTDIGMVDESSIMALENLRLCVVAGIPNDKAKFCLPDSLSSECIFTINARSLRNWFELRTNPRALWEIRILAYAMFYALPECYKFMFADVVYPR
jgi:thymidylate synthase (FAD)